MSETKHGTVLTKEIRRRYFKFPHFKLVTYLQDWGIGRKMNVFLVDESYTSKCSASVFQTLPENRSNKGSFESISIRQPRGLLTTRIDNTNLTAHSDANGALNILRKKIPDSILLPKMDNFMMLEDLFIDPDSQVKNQLSEANQPKNNVIKKVKQLHPIYLNL
jgi:hypothetical protein